MAVGRMEMAPECCKSRQGCWHAQSHRRAGGQQGTGTGTRRWVGGHRGHTVLLLEQALGQLQREVLVSAL